MPTGTSRAFADFDGARPSLGDGQRDGIVVEGDGEGEGDDEGKLRSISGSSFHTAHGAEGGQVSMGDIKRALLSILGAGSKTSAAAAAISDDDVDAFIRYSFAELDTDNSGLIDVQEFSDCFLRTWAVTSFDEFVLFIRQVSAKAKARAAADRRRPATAQTSVLSGDSRAGSQDSLRSHLLSVDVSDALALGTVTSSADSRTLAAPQAVCAPVQR